MQKRKASCLCGDLTITVVGEPKVTLACNCQNCQRRTGSAFGISAYFTNDSIVETTGDPSQYQSTTDSEKNITQSFCRQCGSTVYWQADIFRDMTGIAVGCFNDPDFPRPSATVWNRSKFHWVTFPDSCKTFEKQ